MHIGSSGAVSIEPGVPERNSFGALFSFVFDKQDLYMLRKGFRSRRLSRRSLPFQTWSYLCRWYIGLQSLVSQDSVGWHETCEEYALDILSYLLSRYYLGRFEIRTELEVAPLA